MWISAFHAAGLRLCALTRTRVSFHPGAGCSAAGTAAGTARCLCGRAKTGDPDTPADQDCADIPTSAAAADVQSPRYLQLQLLSAWCHAGASRPTQKYTIHFHTEHLWSAQAEEPELGQLMKHCRVQIASGPKCATGRCVGTTSHTCTLSAAFLTLLCIGIPYTFTVQHAASTHR